MTTVPVSEPFQDLDAILAMAITMEDRRATLRGADAIAVRAIVALSHAGAAIAQYRERCPRVELDYAADPRRIARELMADLTLTREVATDARQTPDDDDPRGW